MTPAMKPLPSEPKLVKLARIREAVVCVGASTARGMATGTVEASRDFLRSLDLRRFVTKTEDEFLRQLDASTDELASELPRRNEQPNWGGARKFLNIFLRGCLYNRYVCKYYRLDWIERFLEVPLDKSVATGLRSEHRNEDDEPLSAWPGVSHLCRDTSRAYQAFASRVARSERFARVHLDLKYFRRGEQEG